MSAEAARTGETAGRRAPWREVGALRRIGRAALRGGAPRDGVPDGIEHLVRAHRQQHPRASVDDLTRAYRLAEAAHRGQWRKSGEPYITHPLAVTLILAELGAGTTTLTASLLHDTVEDTEVTLSQVREDFGAEVGHLVDGVTKLEKVDYGAAAESETFRKMLVAAGSDVRVMSIKLADRLHNMRTVGVMRPEKQARIARVTRDVLIPLAERLGVQAIRTELEDLVFAVLHPDEYARATALTAEHRRLPDPLAPVAASVATTLREAGIPAEVRIRPRHVLSVHRAGVKRGGLGSGDFGRLLVLVGEDADCYAAVGELHTCYTPLVAEFKDFVAAPKFNLYRSLHTAIADTEGRTAEVLIRTHRMHRVAEGGVIALGDPLARADGEGTGATPPDGPADPTRPGWLSRLLAWQEQAPDPDTFWRELRDDLAQDREITVLAGRTDPGPLQLPSGATCVDAAYAAHGAAAHGCLGARVNGRLAPLRTVLRDGDTVTLLLDPEGSSGPAPEWLDHAHTPAARIAIRQWLDGGATPPAPAATAPTGSPPAAPEPPPNGGSAGSAPLAPAEPPPSERGPAPHAPSRTGGRSTRPADTQRRAAHPTGRDPVRDPGVVVAGDPDPLARLARCCTPVPPDPVTAFAVRGGVTTVHRERCPIAGGMASAGRAALSVRWRSPHIGCRVTLRADALGRPTLLADLTEALATHGADVLRARVDPPREQRVRHLFTVALRDASDLPALMRALRGVPGVYDVDRALRPPV